jgi:Na+-transporting NADH:ubiquinone oxidoreductase subunit NqrB
VKDARVYQILFLGLLLGAGAWLRDFSIQPAQIVLTFLAGLLTQNLCLRACALRGVGYLSPVITCFGLSLLLRADNLWVHPLCASVAIAAKFLIRYRHKHLFNPANLGVMLALIALPGAWVSPGQWGHDIAIAAWVVALGGLVTHRARRADISWLFLLMYLGASAARVAWLGQPWGVWTHQLQNGSLLLFAFFMISDPMTIPNHPRGRVAYAALVAGIAFCWQYQLFKTNGLFWALLLASPTVPLWDALWPAAKFNWQQVHTPWKGTPHATPLSPAHPARPVGIARA